MGNYKITNLVQIVPDSAEIFDATYTFQVNYMPVINVSSMHITLTDICGSKVTIDSTTNAFVIGNANEDPNLLAELESLAEGYIQTLIL